MDLDEPFTPTTIVNESFHLTTDLENYSDIVPTMAIQVYDYITDQRAEGWENTVHTAVRLENVTHTSSIGKGVIPLPKGHRDASLTGAEVTSAAYLEDRINEYITELRHSAKY